ncbi:hypothetical protein DY000_02023442 [Brassica cretica]|uniref:Uncharacterized protein n=1 Tax=Brassica cretica TaxID=69181 RepID=A0ABQ7E478_BRACR|nr:hypothetical protein DY000_02023442 [Brassica cretica]
MHSFTDFEANCDLRGDLHGEFRPDPINLLLLANSHYNSVSVVDVVGHLSSSKVHCLIFSYEEISDAMCGFDRILQISEGGFRSVYKAIINDPTATGGDSHSVPLAVAAASLNPAAGNYLMMFLDTTRIWTHALGSIFIPGKEVYPWTAFPLKDYYGLFHKSKYSKVKKEKKTRVEVLKMKRETTLNFVYEHGLEVTRAENLQM